MPTSSLPLPVAAFDEAPVDDGDGRATMEVPFPKTGTPYPTAAPASGNPESCSVSDVYVASSSAKGKISV